MSATALIGGALAVAASRAPVRAFSYGECPVRVVMRDGEPWFVLTDVCMILDLGNPSQAAARLDDDEKETLDAAGLDGMTLISNEGQSGRGGARQLTIVNLPGLFNLVGNSRKPEAKAFGKWVRSEVLTAVARQGAYIRPGAEVETAWALFTNPDVMRAVVARSMAENARLAAQNALFAMEKAEAEEKVAVTAEALAVLAGEKGALTMRNTSRVLGVQEARLKAWLLTHDWFTREPPVTGNLVGYADKRREGLLTHTKPPIEKTGGRERIQVRITLKGALRLARHRTDIDPNAQLVTKAEIEQAIRDAFVVSGQLAALPAPAAARSGCA